ncbi:MAG: hypothetical protein P0Y56_10195 [Candidatus Andeanibacterium colombiense]|uniref:Uncharacterized protein n=1 Tax=Candidatus Andeanibacterium colombiense TaxID=3121345 RepID=A0AAJ5X4D2_9SPHN|nr:MAG: hypothetical protein P0Y56_10195 [Sphingomonadaceae bacterium]
MRDFFSILSQLGWGLTIGALTAAVTALGQLAAAVLCVLAGGGCGWWWWRRRRARASADPEI